MLIFAKDSISTYKIDSSSVVVEIDDSTLPSGFIMSHPSIPNTYTWTPSQANLASQTFSVQDLTPTSIFATQTAQTNKTINNILSEANTAVGLSFSSLSTLQIKALLGCLLYKEGVINPDLTIATLSTWL